MPLESVGEQLRRAKWLGQFLSPEERAREKRMIEYSAQAKDRYPRNGLGLEGYRRTEEMLAVFGRLSNPRLQLRMLEKMADSPTPTEAVLSPILMRNF